MRPLTNGDLRAANHTALTTAIADISMRTTLVTTLLTVESQRWLYVLECARTVGATYKCPSRKDIGEDLVNANTENYKTRNLQETTVDADTFGLSMLGHEATIKNGVVQCHGAQW